MDGIILINKEKNYTSHDVVNIAKKVFNTKVGHTGTLDPNATGLLPLLIGEGTKLSFYLINHDKEYEVVLKLGVKTDTADSEGNVIEKQKVDSKLLNKDFVEKILKEFIGKQNQIPPIYSAIKVNGKKLYEYARKKQKVDIKPRSIEIYNIELNNIDNKNNLIYFTVSCSKGTYIRSLCEDIAEKMGTVGYMLELNRTKVGIFNIEDSIKVDDLIYNKDNKQKLISYLISIEDIIECLYGKENKISLDNKKLKLFLNGVKLRYNLKDSIYRIYDKENNFIGIGSINKNLLKREIILAKNNLI